ncbi:MAG: lytic murein transglycosylase [Rhodocyclaceae bacterium]|nr:lytic murein transglycosylase [Rhodocyclaceae bacterium]
MYGHNGGKNSPLATLATLAFDYPPRAELFRNRLEALLLLAQRIFSRSLAYGIIRGALEHCRNSCQHILAGLDFDGDGQSVWRQSTADTIWQRHANYGQPWLGIEAARSPSASVSGERFA